MKKHYTQCLAESILLALLSIGVFFAFLVQGQENPQANPGKTAADANKKKKGPGTPVVNAQELPLEMTTETMEVLRMSLGVECAYCHVSGEFLERGHTGDRQSDANPRKLIARDMIKMTKEINKTLTGIGTFPDPSNVVTCWSCHRGSRRPPTSAPTSAPAALAPAAAKN
jgi:hypothetical protein